jgi:hypothetical protein
MPATVIGQPLESFDGLGGLGNVLIPQAAQLALRPGNGLSSRQIGERH